MMKTISQKHCNVDILQKVEMSSRKTKSSTLPATLVAHGDGQSDVPCRCTLCDVSGYDVRMLDCGCALHAVREKYCCWQSHKVHVKAETKPTMIFLLFLRPLFPYISVAVQY